MINILEEDEKNIVLKVKKQSIKNTPSLFVLTHTNELYRYIVYSYKEDGDEGLLKNVNILKQYITIENSLTDVNVISAPSNSIFK
jgi:hypothetical protein